MKGKEAGARPVRGLRTRRTAPQASRALRACVAVCLLCLGAYAFDGVGKAVLAGMSVMRTVEHVQTGGPSEPSSLVGGDAGVLGLGLATEREEAPPWFADELFALDEYSNVAVAAGGTVVGFEADGAATHAYAHIAEKMRERGWTEVGSGLAGNGAFGKDGGSCSWAWVSCTDVSGTTSVVVQCVHDSGQTE